MEQSKINEIISYVMGNKKTIRLNNQYKNYIVKSKSDGVNELLYGKEFKISKDDGIFDKHLVYLKVISKPEYEMDCLPKLKLIAIHVITVNELIGSKKEHKPIQDNIPYDRICYDLTSMNLEHRESVYHAFENCDENFNKNWDQLITYNTIEPKHAQTVYILLAIDSFTKIAKGRCLTTKRVEFKNKVLDEFIKLFPESKSVHGAPRTPTSQGVIERLNQTLKNTIRGLMQQDDKKKNLCEYLEIALDIYNNSRNRAHGLTPFQSTGEKPMFHQIDTMDCFFTKLDGTTKNPESINKTIDNQLAISLINSQNYKNSWKINNKSTQFTINDEVLLLEKGHPPIKCKIVEIKKVESMQTYKDQFLENGVNSTQRIGSISGFIGSTKIIITDAAFQLTNGFTSTLYNQDLQKDNDILTGVLRMRGLSVDSYNLSTISLMNNAIEYLNCLITNNGSHQNSPSFTNLQDQLNYDGSQEIMQNAVSQISLQPPPLQVQLPLPTQLTYPTQLPPPTPTNTIQSPSPQKKTKRPRTNTLGSDAKYLLRSIAGDKRL
ncbi:hypothetical protein ACTFIR_012780 [Dictyostelium discoideum]